MERFEELSGLIFWFVLIYLLFLVYALFSIFFHYSFFLMFSFFFSLFFPVKQSCIELPKVMCRSSYRDSFPKYLFFFSRSNLFIIFQEGPFVPRTDMNFPGGSICSLNRHEFFRRAYRKNMFFQGGSICSSNRPFCLIEQILIFPRNPYLVLEHIRIFQEPLFHRSDTHFSGSPI